MLMSEFSTWMQEATPDRKELKVCFDRRLLSDLAQARARLDARTTAASGTLGQPSQKELRREIEELEKQIQSKLRTVAFEGLGWGAWRDLLAKHPPAADQADTFRRAVELLFMPHAVQNVGFNAETFIPAAISACCVEPGITETEAMSFLKTMPSGVVERVWSAVLEVNHAGAADPFAEVSNNGSAKVQASGRR